MNDVSVIIPCLNESHKVLAGIKEKLESYGAEVIIVDDGSRRPYNLAFKHGSNFGYGSAILTGIRQSTRPLVLTMDGDGQHRPEDARNLYTTWKMLEQSVGIDMLIGARRLKGEKWFRYLGRKCLNILASIIAAYWLPDLNSGLRLFRKEIVQGYSQILCKTYSFTTSLTISMMADNYRVEWFPIKVQARKGGFSKVRLFRHGLVTLYYILRNGFALRTRKLRARLRPLWQWARKK